LERDVSRLLEHLEILPEPKEHPVFIVLSGLPGTGKSFFSRRLSSKLPLAVLESDALRKILFPQPTYQWYESARLFRACYYLVEQLLVRGISVLLDATNLSERYRKKLYNIAHRTGVKFIIVEIKAPAEVVHRRLEARARSNTGYSDADWSVYQAMRPRAEPIRMKHFTVDSTRDITPLINKIVREVK
jgi:predicted kinase